MNGAYWVELLGVTFSGRGSDGIGFTRLIDWYGLPGARGDLDEIAGAHGSFQRTVLLRESPVITVEGAIHAPSRLELEELRDGLTNVLAGTGLMRVSDESGTWQRVVDVERVNFEDVSSGARAMTVVVDVTAADPVRYSEVLTAGPVGVPVWEGGVELPAAFPWAFGDYDAGSVEIDNFGTLDLFPKMILTGSASSVVVHGGPRRLSFGAFDGELVFDSRSRRAVLNGVDVTRRLVLREWPVLAAGESAVFRFDSVGASADLELLLEYQIGVW